MKKDIFKIAFEARKLTEKFARKYPKIGHKTTLQCYCAIGSKIFQLLALKNGIKIDLIQGNYLGNEDEIAEYNLFYIEKKVNKDVNHCWNEYDGNIIDITATQFGIKNIVHILSRNYSKNYFTVCMNEKFTGEWGNQNPEEYEDYIKELIVIHKNFKNGA